MLALALATGTAAAPALILPAAASAATIPLPGAQPAPIATSLGIGPGNQTVPAGTTFPVRVRLTAGGSDVPGELVYIYYRPSAASGWQFWHEVRTDGNGYAALSYTATHTEEFTARFRGDSSYAASDSTNYTYSVSESLGQRLVQEAARHNGAPYQYGAAGPSTFDCSGFTMYVASRFGRSLAHSAAEQYNEVSHVAKGAQQVGDLVFFYNSSGIYHVGFYAGHDEIWAATHTGDYVRLESIYSSDYLVGRLH